ncbi:regulatory protein RecX [Breznakiellaceae bacterium SP9]
MLAIESVKTHCDGTAGNVYTIVLSTGIERVFRLCYIPFPYQECSPWVAGRVLTPDEEYACRFAAECFQVEQAALHLISCAEQSAVNLSSKLIKRGHTRASVQAVITHLQDLDLLNDSRYARMWLESRTCAHINSPKQLLAALCRHGLAHRVVHAAYKSVFTFEKELSLLTRYVSKKHIACEGDPHQTFQQLQAEGFSSAVLHAFLDALTSAHAS